MLRTRDDVRWDSRLDTRGLAWAWCVFFIRATEKGTYGRMSWTNVLRGRSLLCKSVGQDNV